MLGNGLTRSISPGTVMTILPVVDNLGGTPVAQKKKFIWPFVILFIAISAAVAAIVGISRGRVLAAAEIMERRPGPAGLLYELANLGFDKPGLAGVGYGHAIGGLRSVDEAGKITACHTLPGPTREDMFAAWHIVGVEGETVYLYVFEASGDSPARYGEAILAVDMAGGVLRKVADTPSPTGHEVLFARDMADGGVYLGGLYADGTRLAMRRVDVAAGGVTDAYDAVVDFPLSAVAVASPGQLYALAQDSRVYRLEGERWTRVFTPADGQTVTGINTGDDGAVYLRMGDVRRDPLINVLQPGAAAFAPVILDTGGAPEGFVATGLHVDSPDRWVANWNVYNSVFTGADGTPRAFSGYTVSVAALWNKSSVLMLAGVMACAALLLVAARRVVLRRRLRLLPKLLLILVPVFTLGIFSIIRTAAGDISLAVEEQIVTDLLESADDAAGEFDAARFAAIDWDNPFSNDHYLASSARMNALSRYRVMANGRLVYTDYWVYRVEDNVAYTAMCGGNVVGIDVRCLYSESSTADILVALNEPYVGYQTGAAAETGWIVVFEPVFLDNRLIGVIEISQPVGQIDTAVRDITQEIVVSGAVIFVGVMAAFVAMLAISTRTLRRLSRGAMAVSGGDYAERVLTRSWDETGEIASSFNRMAASVEESIENITAVGQGYSRFVSDRLIELLGKQSIRQVAPGDHAHLTGANILLSTAGFDDLRDKAFFDALGRFYAAVIPCVSGGGGLIGRYSEHGFNAMFEGGPLPALEAVLAIYAALGAQNEQIACHVFLTYSSYVLGVTGNGEHLNMIVVSQWVTQSYEVGRAGRRMGARLIVGQQAYTELGDAVSRYRHRFLGYLRDEGRRFELYDFYDCDPPEIRLGKDETTHDFERGVRLYFEGDFSRARALFLDIIKAFPEDLAAREYLRRSHAGLTEGGEPKPVLELT